MDRVRSTVLSALLLPSLLALSLVAQDAPTKEDPGAPIQKALETLGEDVRVFDEHIVTLAGPFMEGRVPGSRGMEIAKEYFEWHLKRAGLQPAFGDTGYRQPFDLGGTRKVVAQSLSIADQKLTPGVDYECLGATGAGNVEAPCVFVGYGIESGPPSTEWSSYPEEASLEGKIAVMFRFEPVNEEGKSAWSRSSRRPWSRRAGFAGKIRSAVNRGAAGIVIINPPGTADDRAASLMGADLSGRPQAQIPMMLLSQSAGEKLFKSCGKELLAMRQAADEGAAAFGPLKAQLSMSLKIDSQKLMAENVGGILPGKGALADELVVIGAHLDHLGMGKFGSRGKASERGQVLHPGADDNASGSAAILMLAGKLADRYAKLPADASARTVLFMGFSAEESGLNGSRHYVEQPIRPIEKHAVMINFDMIGRVRNNRITVSGLATAKGMQELLTPVCDKSPLDVRVNPGVSGGSDHLPFYRKGIPVLGGFSGIHPDYHTPRDTSWMINRVGAARTIQLFDEILYKVSTHDGKFEFENPRRRRGRQ